MLEFNNLFDEQYYLLQNRDVAIAIGQGIFTSGLDHYQRFGQFEGRSPSGFFAEDYYLSRNPDVAQAVQAGVFRNGLQHFINNGQAEGRQPSVFFNPSFYLDFYSDVDTAVANGALTPIEHFVKYGQFEKRDPFSEFYTLDYLAENPDVAQAVQATANTTDPLTAIEHFVDYGQYEGRNFGPDFNTSYYLQQNPDVAAAVRPFGLSPIKHYLQFGINEGRLSFPLVDPGINIPVNGARNLGTIGTANISDFVGNANPQDLYRFNITTTSTFSLRLDGLSADADVSLLQDTDDNGEIDLLSEEFIDISQAEGVNSESISRTLEAGTYFVAVDQFEGETNYNLSLSAIPITDAPPDGAGNNLSQARDIGILNGTQTFNDFVGNVDPNDFYRFNINTNSDFSLTLDGLSADADVQIIQDTNNNGLFDEAIDATEAFDSSSQLGVTPEAINLKALSPGTYFVQVLQWEGDTNYNLTLSARPFTSPIDGAGNTLGAARDIGNLSGNQTFNDFVGEIDKDDFYRFTLNAPGDFSLLLDGLTADADVQLIQDINNNGVIDAGEDLRTSETVGNASETINFTGLGAGSYFVHVYQYSGDTDYNLNLSAVNRAIPPDNAGNTLDSARNIGILNGSLTFNDFVGAIDTDDFYRFNLAANSNFSLDLKGLSADADVELLAENGSVLKSSNSPDNTSEAINTILDAGNYFVRVFPYTGDTNYQLDLSATATAAPPPPPVSNDTLASAEAINIVPGTSFEKNDQVSDSNLNDFYRFTVAQSGIFTASIDGLTGDADLRLIRDFNGNQTVDPVVDRNGNITIDDDEVEVLAYNWNRGNKPESIRYFLTPGTYFLQVSSFNKQASLYNLGGLFNPAISDDHKFSINVNFGAGTEVLDETLRNAVREAAHVWERAISYSSFSGEHTISIDITSEDQDGFVSGRGATLASARARKFTQDANGNYLSITGEAFINSNAEVLDFLLSDVSYFRDVMTHEFGHVLGLVGTFKDNGENFLNKLSGLYSGDNTFASLTYGEFKATFAPIAIPITTGVGQGSDFYHWQEETFNNELMTHAANRGVRNVLSELTIASLKDYGYNVNFGAAEPYTLPR